MTARSTGVILYRMRAGLEVLLVHPGGPYWRGRDRGAWQIPKGEIGPDEPPETAARREVEEELGVAIAGELRSLGEIRQAGGKWVLAYAAEQDLDPAEVVSNTFALEWPPRSGKIGEFPEVDAARWMDMAEARAMMLPSQLLLLDRLIDLLKAE